MPNDRLSIKFNGEDRELFMSFKRLNSCLRATGNGEEFLGALVDPDQGELLLQVLLAEKGQDPFTVELDEDSIEPAEYIRIMDWIGEHIMGFFKSRLEQIHTQGQALEPLKAKLLKSQQAGSPA